MMMIQIKDFVIGNQRNSDLGLTDSKNIYNQPCLTALLFYLLLPCLSFSNLHLRLEILALLGGIQMGNSLWRHVSLELSGNF